MAQTTQLYPEFLTSAAQALIAENGYAAMSMRQLASKAGILPGSLYHHISCKQDLLLSVLLEVIEQRVTAWAEIASPPTLENYIQFHLQRQQSHPVETILLRHEVRHLGGPHKLCFEKALRKLKSPVDQIIRQGQKTGKFGAPTDVRMTDAVISVIEAGEKMLTCASSADESWVQVQVKRMCEVILNPPEASDRAHPKHHR